MEWLFIGMGATFIVSVPTALLATFVFFDVAMYQYALVTGMASISTMLNYALIRIGRVSNYYPERHGSSNEGEDVLYEM